jgi:hypothetical protein
MGRIGGAWAEYQRSDRFGLYFIRNDISVFRSVRGAHAFNTSRAKGIRTLVWYGSHAVRLPNARVGAEMSAWIFRFTHKGFGYQSIELYFRRGHLEAGLDLEGLRGSFGEAKAVALARSVDKRLAQAQHLGG